VVAATTAGEIRACFPPDGHDTEKPVVIWRAAWDSRDTTNKDSIRPHVARDTGRVLRLPPAPHPDRLN
jgi:hypothetical protein